MVKARGRRAALPDGGPATERGLLDSTDGKVMVRCFSQDGEEFKDFNFTGLTMAPELRDALVGAFVKRTAPGSGRTSVGSIERIHRTVVVFDRFLATLPWPPQAPAHLTPEIFDQFAESRSHLRSVSTEVCELRNLLVLVEGITDALAGRLAGNMPSRGQQVNKHGYSREEFTRIAETARADLRAAAKRIREHRDLLQRFRDGELDPGQDKTLTQKLRLLEFVDAHGDVPRREQKTGVFAGRELMEYWATKFGRVVDIVSWLHLNVRELSAAAVLLGVMTGQNPEVIVKIPAVHFRADGHLDGPGTAIVGLRKLRRGRRAFMDLALTDVPDWITTEIPEEVTARDELHTPFGLYALLHELTARSRALAGGNRLLVGYSATGGYTKGRGLRPLDINGPILRWSQFHQLTATETDEHGNKVARPVRLDLIRLTYIELHQKPVAHTETTTATYMLRNRGNITEYRQVVADTLQAEAAKARARGTIAVMSAADVERVRKAPVQAAAEFGLDEATLKRMLAGALDTVMAACTDNTAGPHNPGEPCRASFMQCLDCECARALPRHLPVQVLVHDRLAERRQQIDPLRWAERFAGPHAQLADLLDQHDDAAVEDARQAATADDHALVDRFLNRELDLR